MSTHGQCLGLLAGLSIERGTVAKRREQVNQTLLRSVANGTCEPARGMLEVAIEWNRLLKYFDEGLHRLAGKTPTFVADAWFLRDLVRHLTLGPDEEISYVTGAQIGAIRILSRICPVRLAKQSVVYARGDAKACSDALIEILEQGNLLHVMAHSHPGRGPGATHESGIDINYMRTVQRRGAEIIGLIVTRDGYCRAFSVEKPFQFFVLGNGVKQVEENVYHVAL